MSTTNRARSLRPDGVRVMISPRVWTHLEGTQAYADLRAIGAGGTPSSDTWSRSLIAKVVAAPVTRKDRRFAVYLTRLELEDLRVYIEAMATGAADNTWDPDGRADLFAANALLAQLARVGA